MSNVLKWMMAVALLVALFAPQCGAAAVPRTFSYQGYLTKTDGSAVSATVPMTFSLYAAATGGTALWSETHSEVAITGGAFSVVLGQDQPMALPFDVPYYLATKVGSDAEMTPRQPLNSVPFALRAGCIPGDMISCYTGDLSTLGTGLCRAGVRTCNAEGTGFGACVGEILPNTTAAIQLAVSSNSDAIGGSGVTVRAAVTRAAGGSVADGTPVQFSAAGVGSLTATSAVTSGGIATVTYKSSVAGTGTVTATAGTVTASTGEIVFRDPAKPTTAVLKLATQGTLPSGTAISGISASVAFPYALGVEGSDFAPSGLAAGSLGIATVTSTGVLRLGLVSATGFSAGEFATVTFDIATPGYIPAADSFVLSAVTVTDRSGAAIPGVSARVLSVTPQ